MTNKRGRIKVLLHAMTFMRDFGFVYTLSKILERLGCDVFVCSNTDYISTPMKLWSPDVVFYVTVGRTADLFKAYPKAAFVLWNAESCRFDTYPPLELDIASCEEKYQRIGRVLLWGEKTKDMILEYAAKNSWEWITDDIETFNRKFVVVGHPRIDLAVFGGRKKDLAETRKTRIGMIGLFAAVNNGKNSIPKLLLGESNNDDDFSMSEEICFQAKYYQLIKKIIRAFGNERYEYSLRPYFLENISNYKDTDLVKSGKLTIDNSIEFASWLKNQDLVIGAVSTTMYLVAAAGKPYIGVDYLLGRPLDRIVFAKEYLSGIQNYCPRTFDELARLLKNHSSIILTFESSDILKRQYYGFLKADEDLPVLLLMARQILGAAQETNATRGIPKSICDILNRIRTSYAEIRGLNSGGENYSHFSRSIMPKAEAEFSGVVDAIFESISDNDPHKK